MNKFILICLLITGCNIPVLPKNKFGYGQIVYHPILAKECQVVEIHRNYDSNSYLVRYRNDYGVLETIGNVKEFELTNAR